MNTLTLELSDMRKSFKLQGVPSTATVGELITDAVKKMKMQSRDENGSPISYKVRLDREGRHLNNSEMLGDVCKDDDRLEFEPDIEAGFPSIKKT